MEDDECHLAGALESIYESSKISSLGQYTWAAQPGVIQISIDIHATETSLRAHAAAISFAGSSQTLPLIPAGARLHAHHDHGNTSLLRPVAVPSMLPELSLTKLTSSIKLDSPHRCRPMKRGAAQLPAKAIRIVRLVIQSNNHIRITCASAHRSVQLLHRHATSIDRGLRARSSA